MSYCQVQHWGVTFNGYGTSSSSMDYGMEGLTVMAWDPII